MLQYEDFFDTDMEEKKQKAFKFALRYSLRMDQSWTELTKSDIFDSSHNHGYVKKWDVSNSTSHFPLNHDGGQSIWLVNTLLRNQGFLLYITEMSFSTFVVGS